MYDQDKLINIIKEAQGTYSLNEFSRISEVDSAYLSRILNKKRTNPPSPRILEKIANASHGTTTYEELMQICGYSEESLETTVYNIYQRLKQLSKKFHNKQHKDIYEVESSIENFHKYTDDLIKCVKKKSPFRIYLVDYFRKVKIGGFY